MKISPDSVAGLVKPASPRERTSRLSIAGAGPLRPIAGAGGRTRALAGQRHRGDAKPAPALAAKARTSTIPIVFQTAAILSRRLVASLNRPGGNVTGATRQNPGDDAEASWFDPRLAPKATAIGLLVNPKGLQSAVGAEMQERRGARGMILHVANASTVGELDTAIAAVVQSGVAVLIEGNIPFLSTSATHCRADKQSQNSDHLLRARCRRRWRTDGLFVQFFRLVPPGRRLCRPHP